MAFFYNKKALRKALLVCSLSLIPLFSFSESFTEEINKYPGKLVDRVVASVNGEPILLSDLRIAMNYFNDKNEYEVLKRVINIYLIDQYLYSKNMATPPSFVKQTMEDIAKKNNISLAQFYEELDKEGMPPKQFEQFLSNVILASAGLKEYLEKTVKVTPDDIELYKAEYGTPVVKKKIEMLTVPKTQEKELSKILNKTANIEEISKALNIKPQTLTVQKGDLKEDIDKVLWSSKTDNLLFAEDNKNIYIIKPLKTIIKYEVPDEKALEEQIKAKKMEKAYKNLLKKLKKQSSVLVFLK